MDAWYWVGAEGLEQIKPEIPEHLARQGVVLAPVLRQRPVGPVHAIDRITHRALCGYTGPIHPIPKPWGEIRWEEVKFRPCAVCRERYTSGNSPEA